jgi:hypothetical protein
MYRRPKFQELLLEIRQEMAREADYDSDLFAEMVRTGSGPNPQGGEPNSTDPTAAKTPTRAKAKRSTRAM